MIVTAARNTARHEQTDSPYAGMRLVVTLGLMTIGASGMYAVVVALPLALLAVAVRLPSLDNKTVRGKVARFSVDVSGSTRTMHTEVDIPNVNGKLIPGDYAEADITLDSNPAALVVPLQAIDRQGDQASVMVVDPDSRIQVKQVTLGIQMPDYVAISSGLSAGQQVVVSDRSGLKAGQTVRPKPLQSVSYEGSASQ